MVGFLKKLFLVPDTLSSTVLQFYIGCGPFAEHLSKEAAEESGFGADTPTVEGRRRFTE